MRQLVAVDSIWQRQVWTATATRPRTSPLALRSMHYPPSSLCLWPAAPSWLVGVLWVSWFCVTTVPQPARCEESLVHEGPVLMSSLPYRAARTAGHGDCFGAQLHHAGVLFGDGYGARPGPARQPSMASDWPQPCWLLGCVHLGCSVMRYLVCRLTWQSIESRAIMLLLDLCRHLSVLHCAPAAAAG